MMGLGLRVCPGGPAPWWDGGAVRAAGAGPPGGAGGRAAALGGVVPWVRWRRVVGCRWVRRSGAGCLLCSELYRGFDGEPTGEANLFRVETRTYGQGVRPRSLGLDGSASSGCLSGAVDGCPRHRGVDQIHQLSSRISTSPHNRICVHTLTGTRLVGHSTVFRSTDQADRHGTVACRNRSGIRRAAAEAELQAGRQGFARTCGSRFAREVVIAGEVFRLWRDKLGGYGALAWVTSWPASAQWRHGGWRVIGRRGWAVRWELSPVRLRRL